MRTCHLILALLVTACSDDAANSFPEMDASPSSNDDAEASSENCSRDNLSAVVDAYFEALAANDPDEASLAADVKFTENAQTLAPGDGLWETAGELQFSRNVFDSEGCGTFTHGVIDAGGTPTIVGVRLKLEGDQVTEVESYIVPETGFLVNPAGVSNDGGADWEGILPANERSTREELNAIADGYFDLFGPSPPDVPFATDCERFENGSVAPGVMHCSDGIPSGGSVRVTNRRYPIADVEAGIAVGFALLFGSLDFHMFKVKNGEIVGIHATVAAAATSTGWD